MRGAQRPGDGSAGWAASRKHRQELQLLLWPALACCSHHDPSEPGDRHAALSRVQKDNPGTVAKRPVVRHSFTTENTRRLSTMGSAVCGVLRTAPRTVSWPLQTGGQETGVAAWSRVRTELGVSASPGGSSFFPANHLDSVSQSPSLRDSGPPGECPGLGLGSMCPGSGWHLSPEGTAHSRGCCLQGP